MSANPQVPGTSPPMPRLQEPPPKLRHNFPSRRDQMNAICSPGEDGLGAFIYIR